MRMSEALFPDSPDTSAVAIVQDHAFEPRTERITILQAGRWDRDEAELRRDIISLGPNEALCRHCRLAEAAHIR
jgi:hypothetical protein